MTFFFKKIYLTNIFKIGGVWHILRQSAAAEPSRRQIAENAWLQEDWGPNCCPTAQINNCNSFIAVTAAFLCKMRALERNPRG